MHAETQVECLDDREGRLTRERALARLAERQHGVVARRQLAEHGLGRGAVAHRLRLGQLHSLHRGVYAVGHRRLTQHGRWMAAVLACGSGAALSHRSAASLWGLARPRRSPVEVTSNRGRSGRSGLLLHRSWVRDDEWTVEAGIPVTTPSRTLLDLAEVLDRTRLARAFEEADRLKLLQVPALERACARAGRRKGLVTLRGLIETASHPVTGRSPLENRFAEFCRERLADLPAPLANISILDNEVDAYWPGPRLVVEMDSWEFHHHRAAFESDRARDAALLAAGYRVVRLTHRRIETEPDSVATELRRMLKTGTDAANA